MRCNLHRPLAADSEPAMRLTLSNKIFAGFSCLSLLTIILGLTTFTFIKQTAENQEKIRLLQEFDLRIQTLDSFTDFTDNKHQVPAMNKERFLRTVAITKVIAEKILTDQPCSPSLKSPSATTKSCKETMLENLGFYRDAATDFFDRLDLAEKISNRNLQIYRKMMQAADDIPHSSQRVAAIGIIHQLEVYKHGFQDSNDPEQINKMKNTLKRIHGLAVGRELIGMAEIFVNINNQAYFNNIALQDQRDFLRQHTIRFKEISAAISNIITQDTLEEQQQIQFTALVIGICSIAMTLLFWLLLSKRLALFIKNQKKAISSIKTGAYDYEIDLQYQDELSELTVFAKTLATSLNDEITDREKSQRENKELQYQLTQAQKLESIGMLAGGVAHDFNNLLTGISGYSELALAQLEDEHPAKRCVEIIAQSGKKAEDLTRQLLAFSRKQELQKQVVNPNTLIVNLTKMLKRMIGEDVMLALKTAADLPNIMADPGLFEQILMNLAVNARDAMPEGGKLTITTRVLTLGKSATADMEGVDPGDFIQVSVADTGKGMTAEVKKRVFDPFFTTKGLDHGSGLGLATVFSIVRQHNGHITLESEPGKGTTFNFFLPAIATEESPAPTGPKATPSLIKSPTGNEIILLVDDNDTAREFICETLELCGYKVLSAENGPQAIKIINQTNYQIDLLLTDVVMPGMSGKDLAITARKVLPGIKTIFMSGYSDRNLDLESVTSKSNTDFLKKPLSVKILTHKVREILDI